MADKSEKKILSEREKILRERRARRFTWEAGDLQFFSSREELEKAAEKEGRKVVWYDV